LEAQQRLRILIDFKVAKIDWKAALGARPPEPELPTGNVPSGLAVKALARRTAMLAEAGDVLAHIPKPGEALHALMTGRYDLMVLIVAILEKVGSPVDALRIATLSFNNRNTAEILHLIDTGVVKRLSLLCSEFFRDHNRPEYLGLEQGFAERAGPLKVAAVRSHAKVVCMQFKGGQKLVLEGSANLRTNSNREQFALIGDAALHDWHAAWIDDMVDHGKTTENEDAKPVNQGRNAPAH
jgi:hypothetical protein